MTSYLVLPLSVTFYEYFSEERVILRRKKAEGLWQFAVPFRLFVHHLFQFTEMYFSVCVSKQSFLLPLSSLLIPLQKTENWLTDY